jgi:class 3 adenylate cyclase
VVSTEVYVPTQQLEPVSKIAAFLGASERDVGQLLAEGRLERALLISIQKKGTSITPSVKNSVEAMVRSLEPKRAAPAASDAGATATIMFTDIVGSSSMIERLGDREGRRVLSLHDDIIRHEVTAHGGVEVKSLGDGFMITFRSVGRGLACAAAIQKDLAHYDEKHPDAPISVRIGLTVGEPIEAREDLFGMSVILAARISAMADGGQVLMSHVAYTLASSRGDFRFRAIGQVELKGTAGHHELYELLWEEA